MSRYEIALSFAGEDRTYVEMVARFLQSHGVSFFYDDYNDVNLWGKDLYAHLVEVYSKAERYEILRDTDLGTATLIAEDEGEQPNHAL